MAHLTNARRRGRANNGRADWHKKERRKRAGRSYQIGTASAQATQIGESHVLQPKPVCFTVDPDCCEPVAHVTPPLNNNPPPGVFTHIGRDTFKRGTAEQKTTG